MQACLFAAGSTLVVVGVVHSVLGEALIFRRLRDRGVVPIRAAPPLESRHVRILWATWHLVSVLGWSFAFLLFRLAHPDGASSLPVLVARAAICAFSTGSILVLLGTRGRHPGWIALLAAAALIGAAGVG